MINLYTENFFIKNRLKSWLKVFLGKSRGPEAVFKSLCLGLRELNREFSVNSPNTGLGGSACVLSGVATLAWAIRQKQNGKIQKLLAGPNLVVMPKDYNGILLSPEIDRVIVPSLWVKEVYEKQAPRLRGKIEVWAAGVSVLPTEQEKKLFDFLIFKKHIKDSLFYRMVKILEENNFTYRIFEYGRYRKEDYLQRLGQCKYMLYLSDTESQGLAMFEAWARGVATLVFERGFYEKDGVRVEGKTACPYLNEECGLSFASENELPPALSKITQKKFDPRGFVQRGFTLKLAAQKFIDIYES